MVTCAVAKCKNSSGKISKNKDGITFHRFPRDIDRRKQWEIAVNREQEWCSTMASAVCSEHFKASSFYLTECGLRRLSGDAVPSLNISPCQDPEPTVTHVQPIEIKSTDSEEVIKLKNKVHRLEIILENRQKRINLMLQDKRRMVKKFEVMRNMVKNLIRHRKNHSKIT